MRIVFVLPKHLQNPSGGFKAIYELADRLAGRGHRVVVVHPRRLAPAGGFVDRLKAFTWESRVRLRRAPPVPWFRFRHRVELRFVPDLRETHLPDADRIVASSWQTAEAVAGLAAKKGRKILYAMDFEHYWTASKGERRRISQALAGPFLRIASSPAVAAMLADLGLAVAATAEPAVDPATFGLDIAPERRSRTLVGFPLRSESFKGSNDAFLAIEILRRKRRGVELRAFGYAPVETMPLGLRPPVIGYLARSDDAALRRFYNEIAIFLLPSHFEGWGLPALEAMACGAAVVATDCCGVDAFARAGETAWRVPKQSPQATARALERLFDDQELRLRLAHAGHREAQGYSWEATVDRFEAQLLAAG